MIVILVGPPGAGKSKQSELLKDHEHVVWISAGKTLRELNDPKTNEIMAKGDLVDDDFLNKIMKEKLDPITPNKVVILDGFPRHKTQAYWLMQYCNESKQQVVSVIHLLIPESVSFQRLASRGRPDDTKKAIKDRLEIYTKSILEIVEFFAHANVKIDVVDGDRPVMDVFNNIEEIIHRVHQG